MSLRTIDLFGLCVFPCGNGGVSFVSVFPEELVHFPRAIDLIRVKSVMSAIAHKRDVAPELREEMLR